MKQVFKAGHVFYDFASFSLKSEIHEKKNSHSVFLNWKIVVVTKEPKSF